MIKKTVHLVIIVLFLIVVCIWEEIAVHDYLEQIDKAVSSIQTLVVEGEVIDSSQMLFEVESLEDIWKQKQDKFCVVLNHQQVEAIGFEIARMKASVINNDQKEFVLCLSAIRFYVDNLNYILGFSVQNLL